MRDSNRRAVLRLVHEHGTLSRAELRERTRLTASAIHYIVDELSQAGFLESAGRAASTGGRPSELWRVNPQAAFTVGVHVGYTDTAAVVCGLDGRIIARSRGWTRPQASAQAILDDTAELIAAVVQEAAVPRARVVGVGVGIPGVVETPAGVSLFSPNLGWHDVPVQEELRARTGFTVWAEHDLRVATLGEWQHGAGQGTRHLLCAWVGTGVGAGVIVDGKLVTGSAFAAGELGHTVVDPGGRPCNCGKRGCLEATISGAGLVERARSRLRTLGGAGALRDDSELTAKAIGDAARQGDETALAIVREAGAFLGFALAFVVNTLNPERIVIGGGVSRIGQPFLDAVRAELTGRGYARNVAAAPVVGAALVQDAGTLGASTVALQHFFAGDEGDRLSLL